jgi:hypothetical protein
MKRIVPRNMGLVAFLDSAGLRMVSNGNFLGKNGDFACVIAVFG